MSRLYKHRPWLIVPGRAESVQESCESDDGCRDESECVVTKPREVDSNLLSEVASGDVIRLCEGKVKTLNFYHLH